MRDKVCVFFADGFEEVEALTVVDLLRRAEVEVVMVSVTNSCMVHGAHGIIVQADKLFGDDTYEDVTTLVLPGGMPGTSNLGAHEGLKDLICSFHGQGKHIAAICAAPSILGKLGLLKGRKAVSYPAHEGQLTGAQVLQEKVVQDDHIITSRGMGTAIAFSLKLIEIICGTDKAKAIAEAIVYETEE